MNIARPARCLFCTLSRGATSSSRIPRRLFNSSPAQLTRKTDDPSVKTSDIKTLQEITKTLKPSDFKPYTEEEKSRLSEEYSPAQIAAIEAGEAAIDPKDMAEQFAIRRDPMKFHYLDDFSTIEPAVDKHIRDPASNSDYNAQLKDEDDLMDDFARFFREMPENATAADWVRFVESLRLTIGKEENELNPSSALVPDLFEPGESLSKDPQPAESPKIAQGQEKHSEEMTDALKKLLQATGYTLDTIRPLKLKTLVSHAVVNQTRLGKIRRQYCLSIAGNGNGLLGIGEAKSEESSDAMTQSRYRAIRNMHPILRYENRTIFGDVRGKVGAVELKLMTCPPGK